ncbi:MAG: hypothetical protein GZ088_09815 [Acidipila sp.]|nr:hypothetical protein [Acidipila sp.]
MAKATTWIVIGGVGLAAMLFGRKKSAFSSSSSATAGAPARLVPAPINANEEVSAGTYRVISSRRVNPALSYVQATGNVGGTITFTSPTSGMFTRNVVSDGSGALLAEVAAAGAAAAAAPTSPLDSAMSGLSGFLGRHNHSHATPRQLTRHAHGRHQMVHRA